MHECSDYCLGEKMFNIKGEKMCQKCRMGAGKEAIAHDPSTTQGYNYTNHSYIGKDHSKQHDSLYLR
jgi:hypothetical protein